MKSPQNKSQKKLVGVILHSFGSLRNTPILPHLYGSENLRRDAQFLYNKSVYKATASIVLCIAEKLPQASMFFLQDRIYNTYPWEYVIDTTQDIFLGIQLEKPMVKSKLNELRFASGYSSENNEHAISYMASVALTGSSFTQSSLSDMVLEERLSDAKELQSEASNSTQQDSDTVMTEATDIQDEWNDEDEFEIDVLNQNSIMKPLTEVIKKIHLEISPPTENSSDMPSWIKETIRAFQETSEINIQLHIAKLIVNYPVGFEKYASSWLLPLIQLATKGYTYGLPINYFVQDLCVVLIVWGRSSDLPSPRSNETRRILFSFVEYLIKNAYHEEQRIMRSNIHIIKGVFENWGKYIPVPTRAIYEQFTHTGDSAHKNIIGLQMVSIVLLNGGNPYDHHEFSDLYDLPEVRFYTDMANNINYKERRKSIISEDAAEVSSSFISVIIINLHQYGSTEKLLALRCIAGCWEDDDVIYHKLTEAGLERMISSRDEKMQIAALTVLNRIFSVLKDYEIDWIIKRIALNLYYSFLKKAYKVSQEKHFALKNEVKAYLFRGLIDKNKNTAQTIYDFIEQSFGFTDDINLTLQKITSELYTPETEDIYLLYSTRLVLSNTKKSYDFDQPIFDKPLPNARFDAENQNINTSWQNASSMMPLFRDTQTQSLNQEDVELELRRTQSLLEFSITQGTNRSLISTFNPDTEVPINELHLNSLDSADQPLPSPRKQTDRKVNPYFKRRFVITPPGASNRFHSSRNEKLEKKLRHLKNTQKEILEKKVTLSRSYRVGELPDVQIKFKDLLLPLEVLASVDYNVSRLLYSSLVVGIINSNDKDTTGYKSKVVRNIQSNIINSTLYFTPTIGSFLRIFFDLNITYQPENLVRTASSNSSNHHIGIALLEKQLEISAGSSTSSKRKYKDDSDDEMESFSINEDISKLKIQWTDLSLLYKEIDEPEIFQKLYLNNVATRELPKEAINAEIRGEYVEAYNNFGEALQTYRDQPYEVQLWTDQMLYCHTQLTQWDEIAAITDARVDTSPITKLWELGPQNPYFDYFVKSHSKFSVMVKRENNLMSEFFHESSSNESHKEYLNKYYACDWSTVSIYNEQYDLALQTIPKSYSSLLTAWTTLHPLAHTSRLAKLCQLERTVEIEDYLKLVKRIKQQDATPEHIKNFFEKLTARYPDMKSDSIAVWDDVIDSRFAFIYDIKRQNINLDRNDLPNFDQYAIKFLSSLKNAALEQNNLDALSNIRSKFVELGATHESQLSLILFSQKHSLNTRDPIQYKYLASTFASSISYKLPQNDATPDAFNRQIIIARSFDIVKQQLVSNPNLFDEMKEFSGFKKAYLWKIGNYCDKSLRLLQDSSSTLQPDIDPTKYCELVMKNYFKAMDKGHIQAIENFPRLLELLELFPEMGPLFKECSLQLDASWKFIRWIPQLVSFIESPIAEFIFPCLIRIADDYPKALYYPFNMSFEHYEWTKESIPAENRQAIEKIKAMIHSPLMEEFCVELQRLTNPDHIVKDFIGLLKLLLDPYNSRMGSIPTAFNARHRGGLSKVFGKNGKRLLDSPAEVVEELTKYYTTHIDPRNGAQERYKSGGLLKSFSPWLATFKNNDFDEELEIPGQYDGFAKPYPELHAKVASFGTQVLIMESIRKPKRLTINGTDEKEYHFLVKGGEDLRLDQRIEQLFGVIPMSLSLGMIEWVKHTKPVKSCIESQEPNIKKWRIVRDSYNSWIVRHAPRSKNIAAPHFAAYADSRSNIEKNFNEISERLPPTLLRDFVLQLASSPEAFLFLRKNFAYSLACISIFGYILGIGDRHLDNFLIDLKSGSLVPIDFGHAFGSATEHLAIPEVVPFRLTRQLVGVLDPLGVSGILETAMVNVLQAVKDEKELLLNIMNVFIKDPLLDWKKAATSESKNQSKLIFRSIGNEQGSWYPQRKMDIVKRKLDGDNPALIVTTEIENGHSSRYYCKDIVALAKGDPDHDIRARTGSSCKNTTDQVQCLINLATDKCVLGVMYGGWMSFV
ncbi:hypothetical protein BDF21DRAFT_349187 [Thamnidium elegans]|nr:hypothetical protein BDF21DRAFT_349187 [Thamnidium elegans]